MGNVSNEQIYGVLLSLKEDMGGVKQAVKDNGEHTLAVSRKADAIRTELTEHSADDAAHGIKAVRSRRSEVLAIMLAAIAVIGFFLDRFAPKSHVLSEESAQQGAAK